MDKIRHTYWQIQNEGVCGVGNLNDCINRSLNLNGVTLLLCTSGCATASINFKKQAIRKGDIVFLPFDMYFIPLQVSRRFSVKFLSVTSEIADDVFFRINHSPLWDYFYEYPVLPTNDKQFYLLRQWFEQTDWILHYGADDKVADILTNNLYNLMKTILIEMKREGQMAAIMQNKNHSWSLVGRFYTLVSRYYIHHREVKFYADKLNITSDYLYKLTYRQSGVSPKEIIDKQVISAIKTLLTSTDMSIKLIASELNFEDPPYMCRYFRRMVNISPLEYRNRFGIS